MKQLKVIIKQYLEEHPKGRERSFRTVTVLGLIKQIHNWTGHESITEREYIEFVFKETQSLNRVVNWVQEHYEYLRGSDYNDKKKLVQQVQVDLGYTGTIQQDINKLKTL